MTAAHVAAVASIAVWLCSAAVANQPGFSGKVAVEVIDEIEYVHKLRLLEDFSFTDVGGTLWLARKGGILDGETVPRQFHFSEGLPYLAEYRKAAVVHDYFSRIRTEPWRLVHRMLYYASIAEGVAEVQAKMLYATVYAGGWRWEPRESSCYRSCHNAASSLAWRPKALQTEIEPLLPWISEHAPNLDEIDRHVDAAVRRPGPHIFAQPR